MANTWRQYVIRGGGQARISETTSNPPVTDENPIVNANVSRG